MGKWAVATSSSGEARRIGWRERFLDRVERLGNALPDPVALFAGIVVLLMAVSALGAALGWSAVNPVTGQTLAAKSLLSEESIRQLFTEMSRTYTGFPPLGLVLVLMLGAGVAEQSGLIAALLHKATERIPAALLAPVVILLGMLTTHAIDVGYLVYVPLAGLLFANAGRNPVLGVILGFVGCATGLAGNLAPGQYDVLIMTVTQTGANLLVPSWEMNPLGNWWFTLAVAATFIGLGWIITARIVEPRLGPWQGNADTVTTVERRSLGQAERRGLRAAALATLVFATLVATLILNPAYSPLYDRGAAPGQQIVPFYRSLAGLLFVLFLVAGWAYGKAAGTIATHRDVVTMMSKGLEGMLPYLVLVFFAAHFVAMFGWSNLGAITAIRGASLLRAVEMPSALLLPLLTTASAWLDFLIASGSAKWTAMAPVVVPMLMLLDISPEMTTAAYRVGDTVTNLISPLNPYFVLTLIFCQRWVPSMRLGTLLSSTLPYGVAFHLAGSALTAIWVALDLPLGPGARVTYSMPGKP